MSPEPTQKRPRKCLRRVFTGCLTCRKRHVRCDENTPSCSNCKRLSLTCDYQNDRSGGKFMFKAVYPQEDQVQHESPISESPASVSSSAAEGAVELQSTDECSTSNLDDDDKVKTPPTAWQLEWNTNWDLSGSGVLPEDALETRTPTSQGMPEMFWDVSTPSSLPASIVPREAMYYVHFLTDVSKILIIYDTPFNSNPYRMLPRLADSSTLIQDTMTALGAMHLATSNASASDRREHYQAAMRIYSSVTTRLRETLPAGKYGSGLEPLATSLLLCMLEKMYGTDSTWKIHLAGAREILETLYRPRPLAIEAAETHTTSSEDTGLVQPMRRFLASLMAYLDVAAACATGEGTLIAGDYWETWGGGWEYNLGAPSFYSSHSPAERALAQIRHSWSRVMSIQAEISGFAKLQSAGNLDEGRRAIIYEDLTHRIANWHASVPEVFTLLDHEDQVDDDSEQECRLLAGAACIQCYILACTVYLDRISTQQLGRAAQDPEIAAAVDRILYLTMKFSSGLDRMAHLWPLFVAGTATIDEGHKTVITEALSDMKNFGFKHTSRALDILNFVWLQSRLFGEADFNAFQRLASTALLP